MPRYFGLKKEVAWGTALAPDHFFQLISEDIHLEHAHEELRVLSLHSPAELTVIAEHVEGNSRFKGTYEECALLWEMLLGGVDSTGVGPYTHTSPPSTGIPFTRIGKSLTCEVHRDQATAWRYSGMKITNLTMEFEQEKGPEFSATWMGKDESQEVPATPTYITPIKPMLALELDITVDAVSFPLFNASISVDFPIDQTFLVGSKVLAKEPLENGGIALAGSAEICFDSMTQYDKFVAGTFADIIVVATNAVESLTLNMGKALFTKFDPTLDERNRVRAPVEWQSKFDTTATDLLQAITVNNQATP